MLAAALEKQTWGPERQIPGEFSSGAADDEREAGLDRKPGGRLYWPGKGSDANGPETPPEGGGAGKPEDDQGAKR